MKTLEAPEAFWKLPSSYLEQFANFAEWIDAWQRQGNRSEDYIGLLHCGFDVVYGMRQNVDAEYAKRIEFYLGVASEITRMDPENPETDERESRMISGHEYGLRKSISKKAVSVLCVKFFKELLTFDFEEGDHIVKFSNRFFETDEVLKALARLFSDSAGNFSLLPVIRIGIQLDESSHEYKVIADGLAKFALLTCQLSAHFESKTYAGKVRARMEEYKPWLIEAAFHFGKIDSVFRWKDELDPVSKETLERLAGYPEKKLKQSLKEGNVAAKLLFLNNAVH